MKITKLEPVRRNAELVTLHIDGAPAHTVAMMAVEAERLRTGDEITDVQLASLLAADERWRARDAALSLLSARARARGELADRLRRKGFTDAAVDYALAEMDRLGFIDDRAFAESWVRDRLKLRPRGTQALVHELGRKRVSADVARGAIARVMAASNVDDDALCLDAAKKWAESHPPRAGEDDVRRGRRLAAFLARRGYYASAIRSAVAAALDGGRG